MSIKTYPDKCLRDKNEKVTKFNKGLRQVINEMKDALSNWIGLAGPQIGVNKQIIIMRFEKYYVMINPELTSSVPITITYPEKCLSCPGEVVQIKRSAKITVAYYDTKGDFYEKTFSGLKAIAIQHELDHLEGKLIIDYKEEEKDNENNK